VRQIAKQQEPASLTAYRQTPGANYDDYREKEELRNSLVAEQGALCCYCMARIEQDWGSMKVEHWRSQTRYQDDQLSYQNLLGGCMGGQGKPRRYQHCDTRKGNDDLKFNPADPSHHIETWITYSFDGSIHANDNVFNEQLDNVLNLNLPLIKNNRKGVWDAVLKWWKSEKHRLHGPPHREQIERELERYTNGVGNLLPYCKVAVYLLRQKLAGMA
jgi:uncharacterized protein (TIGR02646 family)